MATADDSGFVQLANDLLSKLHIPCVIKQLQDVDSSVFITLYEGLCGEQLKDIIRTPRSKEDEVHNCQCVIDALSMDVLHTSLSHINGDDIVNGDTISICNLLDVFSGLLEFILTRIDSEVSDSEESDRITSDPDRITTEVVDSALEREYRRPMTDMSWERDVQPSSSEVTRDINPHQLRSEASVGDGNLTLRTEPIRGRVTQTNQTREFKESGLDTLRMGTGSVREKDFKPTIREPGRTSPPLRQTADDMRLPMRESARAVFPDLSRDKTSNSTLELIQESEAIERQQRHPYSLRRHADLISESVEPDSTTETVADVTASRPVTTTGRSESILPHTARSAVRDSTFTMSRSSNDRSAENDVHPALSLGVYQKNGSNDIKKASTYDTFPRRTGYQRERDPMASTAPETIQRPVDRVPSPGSSPVSLASIPSARDVGEFSQLGVRPRTKELTSPTLTEKSSKPDHHTYEHHLYHHYDDPMKLTQTNVPDFSSVVAQPPVHVSQPSVTTGRSRHPMNSYENLDRLVSSTVAMTRKAVDSSPLKGRTHRPDSRSVGDRLQRLREHGEELQRLTQSLQVPSSSVYNDSNALRRSLQMDKQLQDKVSRRKVTFAHDETSPDMTVDDLSDHFPRTKGSKRHFTRTGKGDQRPSRDYLDKHRPGYKLASEYSDDELSTHSDGVLEYGAHSSEEDVLRSPPRKTQKKKPAYNDVTNVFERLSKEDHLTRAKTRILNKKLQQDYQELTDENVHDLRRSRVKMGEKNKQYWKTVNGEKTKGRQRPATGSASKKSVLLPPKKPFKPTPKPKRRKRSASWSPSVDRQGQLFIKEDDDILPFMLEEFPFLHMSAETVHKLWADGGRQIEQMTRAAKEVQRKKSRAQVQLEEANRKQEVLMNIMKKELSHNQRLREVKDQRAHTMSVKGNLRDKRLQSARSRRYYDDYQIRQRSKMLQRRTREEMVFKKLFKEGLDIQKDRIRDLRSYAKEQRDKNMARQQNEIQSLENYYRDQFSIVAESLSKERQSLKVQNDAQSKVLTQMKRELRRKMEREIRDVQEQMQRDEDDEYFRQLDADRVKERLHMAKYATSRI